MGLNQKLFKGIPEKISLNKCRRLSGSQDYVDSPKPQKTYISYQKETKLVY